MVDLQNQACQSCSEITMFLHCCLPNSSFKLTSVVFVVSGSQSIVLAKYPTIPTSTTLEKSTMPERGGVCAEPPCFSLFLGNFQEPPPPPLSNPSKD